MTKGLINSKSYVSDVPTPNEPTDKLYPYHYSWLTHHSQTGKPIYSILNSTSSTLLNNLCRQISGSKFETQNDGTIKQVIDYSFNVDEYDDINIIEAILGRTLTKKEIEAVEERKAKKEKERAKLAREKEKVFA